MPHHVRPYRHECPVHGWEVCICATVAGNPRDFDGPHYCYYGAQDGPARTFNGKRLLKSEMFARPR